MAKGRKKMPGKIHQLHGSYREDRHGGELHVDSILPDPPDRLDDIGRNEWRCMAKQLHELGVITGLDVHMLEVYCNTFSRWVRTEAEMRRQGEQHGGMAGEISRTPNGYQQQSALLQVSNACVKQMQSIAAEFGFTPATRARMRLVAKQPKQMELSDLLDELSRAKASING